MSQSDDERKFLEALEHRPVGTWHRKHLDRLKDEFTPYLLRMPKFEPSEIDEAVVNFYSLEIAQLWDPSRAYFRRWKTLRSALLIAHIEDGEGLFPFIYALNCDYYEDYDPGHLNCKRCQSKERQRERESVAREVTKYRSIYIKKMIAALGPDDSLPEYSKARQVLDAAIAEQRKRGQSNESVWRILIELEGAFSPMIDAYEDLGGLIYREIARQIEVLSEVICLTVKKAKSEYPSLRLGNFVEFAERLLARELDRLRGPEHVARYLREWGREALKLKFVSDGLSQMTNEEHKRIVSDALNAPERMEFTGTGRPTTEIKTPRDRTRQCITRTGTSLCRHGKREHDRGNEDLCKVCKAENRDDPCIRFTEPKRHESTRTT